MKKLVTMSNTSIDLSIIIVSYNTREYLKISLLSLTQALQKSQLKSEIFVVDNASQDASKKMVATKFPDVHLLANKENIGYAKANNLAMRQARGKYILLLNSDTKVPRKTLGHMVNFMEANPLVGVSTCKVKLANGWLDPACHRGFPTPWASLCYFLGLERLFPKIKLFSGYHLYYLDLSTTHEIDSAVGAFYLVRKSVVNQVGLLDEDFFMYGEDLDWSYRIKQAGWKIMFVPDISITHYKKSSGRESGNREARVKSTAAFYDTMKIFYKKHLVKRYPRSVMWLTFLFIDMAKLFALRRLK